MKPTTLLAREYRGDPLTVQDLIQQRVNFEERRRARFAKPVTIPTRVQVPKPARNMAQWSKVALHAFSRQIYKGSMMVLNV